jgi:putative transport protein
MNSIQNLFLAGDTASAIFLICVTAFLGMLIGKIEVKKIRLGVAGVMFAGLAFAHFGAKLDHHVLHFVREFGLILFVYAIGMDVGPRFFSSLRNDGLKMNLLAVGLVLMGFSITLIIWYFTDLPASVVVGIMSGGVTNTPGLGAAQQVLSEHGLPGDSALAGMGYAVAYPLGIIGTITSLIIVRYFFRIKIADEALNYTTSVTKGNGKLQSIEISIRNINLIGKELGYLKSYIGDDLVISRIIRADVSIVPSEKLLLEESDIICGVSTSNAIENLKLKIGPVSIVERKEVSGDLAMFHVLVTNRKIAGKTIEQIGVFRRYEANITRIFRSGIEILPTRNAIIEMGDTVRVVGKKDLQSEIKQELGNSVKELAHPNTIPLFMGVFVGIIVGGLSLAVPGLPAPVKLGVAGGPLLVAILLGHKGRIGKTDFYMTPGANMMLRELGIILFLACVGLSSGEHFFSSLVNGGYTWVFYGALITIIPVMTISVIARFIGLNYLKLSGLVAGAMTNPPTLEFANNLAPVHAQSMAYATVYPLTMFLRILLAQALALILL